MRNAKELLACGALLIMLCSRTSYEPAKDNAPVLHQTDWTAGIVTDTSRFPVDSFALIREVRAAQHDNYDRIVFEFSGTEISGYRIEYVDTPVRMCGSGKPRYLPGDGWLMISLFPAQMHAEGVATVVRRERDLGFTTILQLVCICDFENIVTWVAAVSTPNRYRLAVLNNPSRLVLDIRH